MDGAQQGLWRRAALACAAVAVLGAVAASLSSAVPVGAETGPEPLPVESPTTTTSTSTSTSTTVPAADPAPEPAPAPAPAPAPETPPPALETPVAAPSDELSGDAQAPAAPEGGGPTPLATTTILSPPGGPSFPYGTTFPLNVLITNTDGVNVGDRPTGTVTISRGPHGGALAPVDTVAVEDCSFTDPKDPSPAGCVDWTELDVLDAGTYAYSAEYSGEPVPDEYYESYFTPSTSQLVNGGAGITITAPDDPLPTSTSVYASAGTSFGYGADFPLDIEVANLDEVPGGRPTGDVTVYRAVEGGSFAAVGTLTLGNNNPPDAGAAPSGWAFYEETEDLEPGTYEYYASYQGEEPSPSNYFGPSDSSAIPVAITIEEAGLPVPEITMVVPEDGVVIHEGSYLFLDSDVVPSGGGTEIETGLVQYYDNGVAIDQATAGQSVLLFPDTGEHTYTAQYLGSAGQWAASALAEGLDVNVVVPIETTLTVSPIEPVEYPAEAVFTVTITRADGGPPPSGTLQVYWGKGTVGSYPVVDGVAQVNVGQWDVGDWSFQLWFDPDDPTLGGSSGDAEVTVVQHAAVNVVLTSTVRFPSTEGRAAALPTVLLHAAVTPAGPSNPNAPPVTGDITYTDELTASGRRSTFMGPLPAAVEVTRPVGTPFVTSMGQGSYTFVAAYSGDASYFPQTSSSHTFNVGTPNPPPPPVVVPPGDLPPFAVGSGGEDGDAVTASVLDLVAVNEAQVEAQAVAAEGDDGGVITIDEPEARPDTVIPDGKAPTTWREGIHQTSLVDSIPTRDEISWSVGAIGSALWLTLLIILLVELPSTLVNSTMEEHEKRVTAPFAGVLAWVHAREDRLERLPAAALLVLFSAIGGLTASFLDPDFGLHGSSLVLLAALTLSYGVMTGVLELLRMPYLQRRTGQRAKLELFPVVLVIGVLVVVVSRLFEFQPGYVFGISIGLLLAPGIPDHVEAKSLARSGVALIVMAASSWLLWAPVVDRVDAGSSSLTLLFLDAFLSTLWVMSLQIVLFEFSSLRGMYGSVVRKWNTKVWLAIYVSAAFLLVKFVLHPSAARWGGLDQGTFIGVMSVFGVLTLGALLFWGWFQVRPGPPAEAPGTEGETVEATSPG
jgi:hypothetical protein